MTLLDHALIDDIAATAIVYANGDRDLAVKFLMEAARWVPLRVPGNAGVNDNPIDPEGPRAA